jgi:hypothetical protein
LPLRKILLGSKRQAAYLLGHSHDSITSKQFAVFIFLVFTHFDTFDNISVLAKKVLFRTMPSLDRKRVFGNTAQKSAYCSLNVGSA